MAVANFPTFPYDFGNWTGPTRTISGFARGGAITPGTAYGEVARAIWVGGAGNIVVTLVDGSNLTFTAITAGTLLPIYSVLIISAGTTATNLIWLS